MDLHIKYQHKTATQKLTVSLPPSKSLWARLLMLYAIDGKELPTLPDDVGNDVSALYHALLKIRAGATEIDVLESGTAMRFLTAYLAATTRYTVLLQGRGRQYQRPIDPLVKALQSLGAKITYTQSEGYPPLCIEPSTLRGGEVQIDAANSSQFVSALLLISPLLPNGLTIENLSCDSSVPYIHMTEAVLAEYKQHGLSREPVVEPDWTAASALYALCALTQTEIHLPGLRPQSLQGDAILQNHFSRLGVETTFDETGATLHFSPHKLNTLALPEWNFDNSPDIVPNMVITCLGLGLPFHFTGVARLRLKESDRILALQHNAAAAGFRLGVSNDALFYDGSPAEPHSIGCIDPMGDHRIAMAFAILACKLPTGLTIRHVEVVKKSWPDFWHALAAVWNTAAVTDSDC